MVSSYFRRAELDSGRLGGAPPRCSVAPALSARSRGTRAHAGVLAERVPLTDAGRSRRDVYHSASGEPARSTARGTRGPSAG